MTAKVGRQIPRRTIRKAVQVLNVVPGVALDEPAAHVFRLSIFGSESVASRASDPDPDDLNRSVTSFHVFSTCHRKTAVDEASNHIAVEPMDEHEKLLSGALRVTGEQFQRLALLPAEAMLSRGRWHRELNLSPPPSHLLITLSERLRMRAFVSSHALFRAFAGDHAVVNQSVGTGHRAQRRLLRSCPLHICARYAVTKRGIPGSRSAAERTMRTSLSSGWVSLAR